MRYSLQSLDFFIDTLTSISTIARPAQNSWVGGVVTLAGYSMDATSGVAGVEVSFDRGETWRAAVGSDAWSYNWDTRKLGANVVLVRGIDWAGNAEEPISLAVHIDNSTPFFDVGPFPSEYCFTCSGPLTFTLTAFDKESGINNSAIVVKQGGRDIRILKAPPGELRGHPVVWDGRDEQGNPVPVGDYQLLFYTANYASLFGSYSAGIRVIDALPVGGVDPAPAPLAPIEPPDDAPWLITPNPPTPIPFIPPSGVTSNSTLSSAGSQTTGESQAASSISGYPQVGIGNVTASAGASSSNSSGTGAGIGALLALMAAYVAARQTTGTTATTLKNEDKKQGGEFKPPTTSSGTNGETERDSKTIEHIFSDPALAAAFFESARNLYYYSNYGGAGALLQREFIYWPKEIIYRFTDISGDIVEVAGQKRVPATDSNTQWLNEPLLASKVGGRLAGVSLAAGLLDLVIPGENPVLHTIGDVTGQGANMSGLARLPALLTNASALKEAATITPGVSSVLGQLAMFAYGGYEFVQSMEIIRQQNQGLRPWNEQERWGEGLQMLGGGWLAAAGGFGFMAALGFTAFALPALPIIAAVGGVLIAAGWAVNNWDKIEAGWEAWKGIISNSQTILQFAGQTAGKAVGQTVSNIANNVKTTVNNVVNNTKTTVNNFVDNAKTTVNNFVDNAKTTVNNFVDNAKTTVNNFVSNAKTTVNNFVNNAKTTVKTVVNNVKTTVKTVVNNVKTTVKTVVNNVKTTAKTVVNNVKTTAKTVVNNVKTTVKATAKTVVNNVKTTVKATAKTAVKKVGNIVKGLFGGKG
ncbi:MAG: hypothetical protein JXB07_06815 [Anaerolineae bacterium]|nr:hypothetical protein [Anaerolineae bacterium]